MISSYILMFLAGVNVYIPSSLLYRWGSRLSGEGISLWSVWYKWEILFLIGWLIFGVLLLLDSIFTLYFRKKCLIIGVIILITIYVGLVWNYFPVGRLLWFLIVHPSDGFVLEYERIFSTFVGKTFFWAGFINTVGLVVLFFSWLYQWGNQKNSENISENQ